MQILTITPFKRPLLWLSVCASLALTACASLSNLPPQEQVRQRAAERWQALVAGEFGRAYVYNTPGFRAVVNADGYRGRFGGAVIWLGAEVVNVNCPETTKCVALVRIDFKPLLSRKISDKISTHVEETWLLEDSQWWFFQVI
jgi:hypothetical protein